MPSQKFELTDLSNSQTDLTAMRDSRSGCHVSALAGFVFLMLSAAVAVGVGVIVHFAGGNREVVCRCDPETILGGQISECLKLASQGHREICEKCPVPTSPSQGPSTQPTAPCPSSTFTASQAPTSTTTAKPKITDVRIPTALYPLHYNIELQTYMAGLDPAGFTFKGTVKIWLRCVQPSDNVTLHINVLSVDKTSLRFYGDFSGYRAPVYTSWSEDKDRQFFILKLNGYTEVGKIYIVEMTYTSPLKDDLSGLYLSTYKRNGQPVYLATTQFQPTDARKVFPCFDEPAIKSTFNVTLVRPSNLTSLSNMPIIDNSTTFEEQGITYVKDVYAQTKKMSTYLLAFIVSDFSYTQNTTKNEVLYRAWSRPEVVSSTKYALDVGINILTYFEEFFNVSFPLPKQDMIAIPDFAAGAMENWGLITYRETAMLYTEGVSNEANKERVAIVVSHELAHQWFGDLVTPRWWDDLWLNEGFATFVEYLGVDHVHPEWNIFEKFALSELQDAFSFDGLVSSHPVYVPVGHPDEINEIFDSISYAKGGSIIRMMRHFLGYETFRKGMNLYLTKLQYSDAFHDDLWAALTE
ncbi:aminopeptidase N, partial [Biomphalaria glabrata]